MRDLTKLPHLLPKLLAPLAVILLSACTSPAHAQRDTAAAAAQSVHPRVIASKVVKPRRATTLRAAIGVELRIPRGVIRGKGRARITELGPGEYSIHIAAPWRGYVSVVLPAQQGLPIVAHRVPGEWILEPARLVNGRAVARVSRLSVFGDLAKCLKPSSMEGLLRCLAAVGVKQLPNGVFKQIVGKFVTYNPCKPLAPDNLTISVLDLLASCPAGEPERPRTQPTAVIDLPVDMFVSGIVNLCVNATDPDGDQPTVSFRPERGRILTPVSSPSPGRYCVDYQAPSAAGHETISVRVSDGTSSVIDGGSFPIVADDF